jgi:hypothetical protein
MPAEEREPKFDRALARQMRAGSSRADCPDAETLAAYHERSLSLEEMSHWKSHIAGCEACQEALALVEMTEKDLAGDWENDRILVAGGEGPRGDGVRKSSPKEGTGAAEAASASPMEMARRPRPALVRWAIPLGVAAAGVLVWIGFHEQSVLQKQAPAAIQMAESRPQAVPGPAKREAEPGAIPPAERDYGQANAGLQAPSRVSAREEKELGSARLIAPKVAADALQKDAGAPKAQASSGPAVTATTNAPPPPSSAAPAKKTVPGMVRESAEVAPAAPEPSTTAGNVGAGAAGAMVGGAVENKKRSAVSTAKAEHQQQAADVNTNAMMMKQGVRNEALEVSAESTGVILTPDHKVWWKLGPGGTVELTTDGGKNWNRLTTGVREQLTSGSAPTSKVCWVAGQGGTLLLTTDRGAHWTKLSAPISGDLGGVHAADAKHATIWDAANRLSFETSDGGQTWKQAADE